MRPTAHLRDGTAQDGPGPNAPHEHPLVAGENAAVDLFAYLLLK
jgi:hypothetical protein